MKKILSLLMCYVFLQAETFALRGGPSGAGAGKVTGSYSGVMIEQNFNSNTNTAADVGLFIMSAAQSGPSVGHLVIFSESKAASKVYNCSMTGLSDTSRGGSGKFYGLFAGAAAQGTGATGATSGETIAGQMILQVAPNSNASQGGRVSGTANTRATGDTTVIDPITGLPSTSSSSGPLKYFTVDGWQTGDSSGLVFAL